MMESDSKSAIDLVALELLHESDEPVGNHRLMSALQAEGIVIAEATAGRILQRLVSQGLAHTIGKRGRVLTTAGKTKLATLRSDHLRQKRSARLLAVSSIADVESLRDMLLVRRAIEPEAARLAATRASAEDIKLLHDFACAHCLASPDDGERVDPAISFHCQLVRASHHPLLTEMGLLVLEQTNTALLDRISHDAAMAHLTTEDMERDAAALVTDHESITQAIRRGDPEEAERRMRLHIDRLLAKTTAYIEVIHHESGGDRDEPLKP
ncbi:FCD domain-containing protein [Nordella sp. HKS 07]|uniref:FadR/GntR family transcriptional regulator n=1 Tax=Nordella sp. HKS 07 TaxID=2712222 RepID=UPI0013E11AA2|nr:FCD domain-containing protein [Nordella sp. HKS 07]QIG48429.1 FCD domain-containing protein [Nordella sp. HKS 07]